MYCSNCGEQLPDDALSCGECGQRVKSGSASSTGATEQLGASSRSASPDQKDNQTESVATIPGTSHRRPKVIAAIVLAACVLVAGGTAFAIAQGGLAGGSGNPISDVASMVETAVPGIADTVDAAVPDTEAMNPTYPEGGKLVKSYENEYNDEGDLVKQVYSGQWKVSEDSDEIVIKPLRASKTQYSGDTSIKVNTSLTQLRYVSSDVSSSDADEYVYLAEIAISEYKGDLLMRRTSGATTYIPLGDMTLEEALDQFSFDIDDYNGGECLRTEYEYDSNGKKTKESVYTVREDPRYNLSYQEGALMTETYYENGQKSRHVTYDADGKVLSDVDYSTDSRTNVYVGEESTSEDGSVTTTYSTVDDAGDDESDDDLGTNEKARIDWWLPSYDDGTSEYDEHGNPLRLWNPISKHYEDCTYEYDEKGNLVSQSKPGGYDRVNDTYEGVSAYRFTYTSMNHLVLEEAMAYDGETPLDWTVYQYNEQGKVVKQSKYHNAS